METNNVLGMATEKGTEAITEKIVNLADLDAVKKKYGEIYEIGTVVDDDDVNEGRKLSYYFRKPSTASFNRYLKTAGKNMAASTTTFVLDNIVDEQKESFNRECEKYPGLSLGLGQKLLSAVGLGDNVNFRKL